MDVGAKEEIYEIMRFLAQQGVTILMVSSDLPEVLRMGDGSLSCPRENHWRASRDEATQEKLMALMLGGVANADKLLEKVRNRGCPLSPHYFHGYQKPSLFI